MKAAVVVSLAVLGVAACTAAPPPPPVRADPALFTVPAEQRARLQVVTVARQPVVRTVSVPAAVAFDDLKTSTVVPLVSGKVAKVLVHEGDHVTAGQPLLVIASPDSSDVAAGLTRDRATLQNDEVVQARDEDLYAHQAISLEELQSAQLAVTQAKAQLADDEARARITGTGVSHAELRAPIGGLVVSRQVSAGNAVTAGTTPCFVITDPAVVWVVAQLYQQDLARVRVGDAARIRSPDFQAPLQGQVTYIGAAIDPDTLTVPVRIAVSNPGGLLKSGMYVSAEIQPDAPEDELVVPASAVLRDDDNLPFVFVQAAPGQFAHRRVTLGEPVEGGDVIASGLRAGEQVLAGGAVFVQFAEDLAR